MSEHTPIPWIADNVHMVWMQAGGEEWNSDQPVCVCHGPDAKANTAFIVRAVNNYERLLEALKDLVHAEWMVSHDWGGDRESVLEKARQAIADAEKEVTG